MVINTSPWWEMLINGEAMHMKAGDIWEISVLPSPLCFEPKTTLNNKLNSLKINESLLKKIKLDKAIILK